METIEIGAVLLEPSEWREVDSLSIVIRPTENPELTEFCKGLTGITQSEVNQGTTFEAGLAALGNFMVAANVDSFASWGAFDFIQLRREAKRRKVPFLPTSHENLKRRFADRTSLRTEISLSRALAHFGMTFEGPLHRALSDARNTARLLPHLSRSDSLSPS